LRENPKQGKQLGAGLYKMRMASESKGGGKSGGFRIITYYIEQTSDGDVLYLEQFMTNQNMTIFQKKNYSKLSKTN
jgi:hypothetical protein